MSKAPSVARTEEERRIFYRGALAGRTLAEVDHELVRRGFERLNSTSWEMIQRNEVPFFREDMQRLDQAILHPFSPSEMALVRQGHTQAEARAILRERRKRHRR